MARFLMAAMLSLLLLACGTGGDAGGGPVTRETFGRIALGQSEADVKALLGEPTKVQVHPQSPELKNLYYGDENWVSFDGGKVFSVTWADEQILEAPEPQEPEG